MYTHVGVYTHTVFTHRTTEGHTYIYIYRPTVLVYYTYLYKLNFHWERFRAEHVDGEILASCDVDCLAELGVTSRIQQLRLAKLIDGTKSAIELLNK